MGVGRLARRRRAHLAIGQRARLDGAVRFSVVGVRHCFRAARSAGDPPRGADRAGVQVRQGHAAQGLRHRDAGARSRHRRLRRGAVLRHARLGQAALDRADRADPGRAGVPRRADARPLPHDRRLAGASCEPRGAAAHLGLPEEARLPRHADLQGAWRARLLGAGAVAHHRQGRLALARRRHHRHGAELARPGRADREVRHRAPEGILPAAARQGRGDPVLRADRPDLGLGRGDHARHRHRHARRPRRRHRHPAVVGQALHHARPQGDAARPRLPAVRSGEHPRQGREPRHHGGADPDDAPGRAHRSAAPALGRRVPQRPQLGQGRHHPHRLGDRRPGDGRPGLAHADGVPRRGARHLAALLGDGRRQGDAALHQRIRPHPQAVWPPYRAHGGHRGAARAHGRGGLCERGGAAPSLPPWCRAASGRRSSPP